jgi:membrane-associated phospholipid phosphatase
MLRHRLTATLLIVLVPTAVLAQDPKPSTDERRTIARQQTQDQNQDPQQDQSPDQSKGTEDKKPTLAAREAPTKPTRGFFSALFHNMGDDVKHMPRLNSVYWLAGGAALAAAVHPADDRVNARLVNSSTDKLWVPGKVIGSTPMILGASFATYVIGRAEQMNRLQHLGMDELEAAILTEGVVAGAKQIGRRDRPLNPDGTRQSGYSFPSGHSATTFAAATVLQQHLGYKAGVPTYLIASYVAASRLHDNRHFASDVVFGAATGIVIGRSVTWHGRNFYASPMLVPNGAGVLVQVRPGSSNSSN